MPTIAPGSGASTLRVPGPAAFIGEQFIVPRSVPSGTGAIVGPLVFTAGAPVTARTAVEAWTRDGVLVTTLPASFDRRWQDTPGDVGSGQFTIMNDDPAAPLVDYGQVVRCFKDGVVCFAFRVEKKAQVTIATDEEAGEATIVSGNGTLGILASAVVQPPFGVDRRPVRETRIFNFASPDLDEQSWGYATETAASSFPTTQQWKDTACRWIWDRSASGSVPAGACYFRRAFTIGSATPVVISVAGDDMYELWLDGEKFLDDGALTGYTGASKRATRLLDAGDHVLAAKVDSWGGRAGLRCTVHTITAAGTFGTLLVRTDSSWRVLGYPTRAPGFTPGEILRILLAEAQARGSLLDFVAGFTDGADSKGEAWEPVSDFAVTTGLDLLSVVRQMGESMFTPRMAAASQTLLAYRTLGAATLVEFTKGVNMQELRHEGTM